MAKQELLLSLEDSLVNPCLLLSLSFPAPSRRWQGDEGELGSFLTSVGPGLLCARRWDN